MLALLLFSCNPTIPKEESPSESVVDSTAPQKRPNIVLVITDDQRWDTLWAMPTVLAHSTEDTNFLVSRVTTPMCCPVRASIWSGGFLPAEVGVIANDPPNGGAPAFQVATTMAQRMQAQGYQTVYYGKYLNGLGDDPPETLPAGWDDFAWTTEDSTYTSWSFWSGKGGEAPQRVDESGYVTDGLLNRELAFLDAYTGEKPFFMVLATMAPHGPVEPAPEDNGVFSDFVYRDRGWAEADMSDKPSWISERGDPAEDAPSYDRLIENQVESLVAVDRMVKALDERLETMGLSDSTVRFFTSDNGYLWEEHRLWGKGVAYEESVRVPLVAWGGGFPKGQISGLVAMNLDVPATIQAMAGLSPITEGLDLRAIAEGTASRKALSLAGFGFSEPPWAAVVDERWKLIAATTGDIEVYDLQNDPFELDAAVDDGAPLDALTTLMETTRPLVLKTEDLPNGVVGTAYEKTLGIWGGKAPILFTATGLPDGLQLVKNSIVGVPTTEGKWVVTILVQDSSVSPITGRPQSYQHSYSVTIGQPKAQLISLEGGSTLKLQFDQELDLRVRFSPDPQMDRLATWTNVMSGRVFAVPLPPRCIPCYAHLEVNGAPGPLLTRRVDRSLAKR